MPVPVTAALAFASGVELPAGVRVVAAAFPAHLAGLLTPLQRYAAENADGARRLQQAAPHLLACANAGGVPPATVEALDDWRALASWLLLAGSAQFRKQVDIHDGFPPPKSGPGARTGGYACHAS